MHDRRIDGVTHTFGNAGALFMTAMTWWDHETQSIWSQPWGRAIRGTYKGVELFLLPSQVTSWASWKEEHPNTLAMINDVEKLGSRRQGVRAPAGEPAGNLLLRPLRRRARWRRSMRCLAQLP